MKRTVSHFTAGLFALALAAAAQAQTPIRITGSTAFRGATVTAISKIFDNNQFSVGYTGTSFTGATAANFRGLVDGVDVLIKTSWSGAEGGVQTVAFGAAPLTVKFLPDDATTTAAAPGTAAGGTSGLTDPTASGGAASTFKAEIPDIAMADQFQSSSAFFGDYKGKNYPTLVESPFSPVGVVAFKFVASKSAPATVTNITSQLAQNLFSAGRAKLSLFTGNLNDTSFVFATGRDPDSGTRLNQSAEIGLGPVASVKHYQPSDANGAVLNTAGGSVAKNVPWPAGTVNTVAVPTFNGGYASGGRLALAMGNTTDTMQNVDANGQPLPGAAATGGFYIAGMSTGDATTAITNGAKELTYNGVAYSAANVVQGLYTFWCYEHVYYRSTATAAVAAVGDKLANQILTTDAPVKISDMKVTRQTDGGKVQ
jgi:hypothetical protein